MNEIYHHMPNLFIETTRIIQIWGQSKKYESTFQGLPFIVQSANVSCLESILIDLRKKIYLSWCAENNEGYQKRKRKGILIYK